MRTEKIDPKQLTTAGKALQAAFASVNRPSPKSSRNKHVTFQLFEPTANELNTLAARLSEGPSAYDINRKGTARDVTDLLDEVAAMDVSARQFRRLCKEIFGLSADLYIHINKDTFKEQPLESGIARLIFDGRSLEISSSEFPLQELNAAFKAAQGTLLVSRETPAHSVIGFNHVRNLVPYVGGLRGTHPLADIDYSKIKPTEQRNLTALSLFILSGATFVSSNRGESQLLTIGEAARLLGEFMHHLDSPPSWLSSEPDTIRKSAKRAILEPDSFWLFVRSFSRPWHPSGFQKFEFYRHVWAEDKKIAVQLGGEGDDNIRNQLISDLCVIRSHEVETRVRSYLRLWEKMDGILPSVVTAKDSWLLCDHLGLLDQNQIEELRERGIRLFFDLDVIP